MHAKDKKNRFLLPKIAPCDKEADSDALKGSKATGDYKDINLNFRFEKEGLKKYYDELVDLLVEMKSEKELGNYIVQLMDENRTESKTTEVQRRTGNFMNLKARYIELTNRKLSEDQQKRNQNQDEDEDQALFPTEKELKELLNLSYFVCELQIHHKSIKKLKHDEGYSKYVHFRNLVS